MIMTDEEIKAINDEISELQKQANVIHEKITALHSKLPPPEPMDERNAFLKLGDDIVGIHAIGWESLDDKGNIHFDHIEIWGNNYDENLKMCGGSFRIFDTFDKTVADFKSEGYIDFVPNPNLESN